MPDEIQFTSNLTLKVLSHAGERLMFLLHLPEFVWLHHFPDSGPGREAEPVFYIDDEPPLNTERAVSYLRRAIEAACEEAWTIYSDLVESGFPDELIRHILPSNLMRWGTVTFTQEQAKDFVVKNRDSRIKELALVAHGYERALVDGHQQRGADS